MGLDRHGTGFLDMGNFEAMGTWDFGIGLMAA
jgi:hypothetical protein